MAENIESIILAAADNPMSFRYWIEATEGDYYGYKLHFNTYTGFGIKPTHHEVKGTVFVHWWDNRENAKLRIPKNSSGSGLKGDEKRSLKKGEEASHKREGPG